MAPGPARMGILAAMPCEIARLSQVVEEQVEHVCCGSFTFTTGKLDGRDERSTRRRTSATERPTLSECWRG